MLGAIEAAHASVRFRPDDQIDRSEAEIRRRGVDNRIAAPVDEGREQAAVAEIGRSSGHPGFVEGEIFGALISPEAIANSRCAPPVTLPAMGTL